MRNKTSATLDYLAFMLFYIVAVTNFFYAGFFIWCNLIVFRLYFALGQMTGIRICALMIKIVPTRGKQADLHSALSSAIDTFLEKNWISGFQYLVKNCQNRVVILFIKYQL